ncbi:hypothetical protein DFH08DRAFT_1089361 [Mycena albidolilacea]|uniref:Uncharacterized protein n=1 Tax=Mycena albidolilacea TaxID=1033008 RepID=A0AAD6Z1E0_9AGAR|nr:hypothetical protein DFH08DRAFT_1089361 [Mycena albidolilacea]
MNHSLFSSTPSPARLQPFSLAVVSAALNSDSPAPPLALSLRTSSPLQRNKSLQNLHTPALRLARAAPAAGTQEACRRHPATAMLHASSPLPGVVRPRPRRSFQLLLHLRVSSFLIFTAIPARLRIALRIRIRIRLVTRPALTSEERAHPPANGAVRIVHHSCDALPLSASHSPPRLLRHGGRTMPTPIPTMRRTGQGRRFHETNDGDAQVADRVFVCRRSRTRSRIGRSRSRLFRLPPSQTSFGPPRASIPPPLADPSSSRRPFLLSPTLPPLVDLSSFARTFSLVHTDNAFPPPSSCAPPPRAPSPSRPRPRLRPAIVSPGVRDRRSWSHSPGA